MSELELELELVFLLLGISFISSISITSWHFTQKRGAVIHLWSLKFKARWLTGNRDSLGSWLAGFRLRQFLARSDLLLRNFHVNDQHIEIFDGSIDADSDSCVLNNFFFFDVRKEWIFTLLFVVGSNSNRKYIYYKN